MTSQTPVLHLLCGKIASGKSTLAASLAEIAGTVLIAEDSWLSLLFSEEITSLQDYVRYSTRLRSVVKPHVEGLLRAGASVVLDFPANTVETRQWMRELVASTATPHQLHLLDIPDEVCLERLRQRNSDGKHPFQVTEAQFHQVTKHFTPPIEAEGFNVVRHRPD